MNCRFAGPFVFLLLCLVASMGARAEYRVAVSSNVAAVLSVDDGQLTGLAAPLYQCIFDGAGLDFAFIQMPLTRSLFHLENGEVAVAVPVARSPARDRYGIFGGELLAVQYMFLSFRQLPPLARAEGLTYVLPRSHLGTQFVPEGAAVGMEVNSWEQVFAMLKIGRADFTVVPRLILGDLLRAFSEPFYLQPAGSAPSSLYIGRAFEHTSLDDKLRESVHTCRKEFEAEIAQQQGRGPEVAVDEKATNGQ